MYLQKSKAAQETYLCVATIASLSAYVFDAQIMAACTATVTLNPRALQREIMADVSA